MPYFLTNSDRIRSFSPALQQLDQFKEGPAVFEVILRAKLLRVFQITKDAIEDLSADDADVWYVLDGLELDAISVLGFSEEPKLTTWVIDSVWSSGFTKDQLYSSLNTSVCSAIYDSELVFSPSVDTVIRWLRGQCEAILIAVECVFSAPTSQSLIAHLIAIHALLTAIAAASMKSRLGGTISER